MTHISTLQESNMAGWKFPFSNRKLIYKWWIFHGYVRLPEGIWDHRFYLGGGFFFFWFIFIPTKGFLMQFEEHIFQMGLKLRTSLSTDI